MSPFDDPLYIAACVTFGVAGLMLSTHHLVRAVRGPADTPVLRPRSRRLVRALRAFLTGVCLLGLGCGLAIGSTGLTVVCLAIGLEELYETTMALSVLGWCETIAAADAHPARVVGLASRRGDRCNGRRTSSSRGDPACSSSCPSAAIRRSTTGRTSPT